MTEQERFLKAARAEAGQSVSVAGSTLLPSAVGFNNRVSARTISTIIRGTTRIDADTKGALGQALELIETDATLGARDTADAVETIDRLREELSEVPPDSKRVRRCSDDGNHVLRFPNRFAEEPVHLGRVLDIELERNSPAIRRDSRADGRRQSSPSAVPGALSLLCCNSEFPTRKPPDATPRIPFDRSRGRYRGPHPIRPRRG